MLSNLESTVALSDLLIIGESGVITSTGGSLNAEVDVEEVLKGSLDSGRIRVAFSTIGVASPPELERGKRYIFFLQKRQFEDVNVYGLVREDPNAILPFNEQVMQEIEDLLRRHDDVDQK